jgi:hypothetical protein
MENSHYALHWTDVANPHFPGLDDVLKHLHFLLEYHHCNSFLRSSDWWMKGRCNNQFVLKQLWHCSMDIA